MYDQGDFRNIKLQVLLKINSHTKLMLKKKLQKEDIDSEDDKNIDLSSKIPSGTNKMPQLLETLLSGISER